MSLRDRLSKLEKILRTLKSKQPSEADLEEAEFIELLLHLCHGEIDNDLMPQARDTAVMIVEALMADEDPEDLHGPPAHALALAERFGIDLQQYAVNDAHRAILASRGQ